MSKTEAYELEKPVWTQGDFGVMGWHDSKVWGMLANPDEWEYWIDLDYIFKWVHPEGDDKHFEFWVAPVTMVFENVYDVKLEIDSEHGEIEVAELHMENPRKTKNGQFTEYTFRFECQEGELSLSATGYRLYVRQEPRLLKYQHLDFKQRGGVNFGRELTA